MESTLNTQARSFVSDVKLFGGGIILWRVHMFKLTTALLLMKTQSD